MIYIMGFSWDETYINIWDSNQPAEKIHQLWDFRMIVDPSNLIRRNWPPLETDRNWPGLRSIEGWYYMYLPCRNQPIQNWEVNQIGWVSMWGESSHSSRTYLILSYYEYLTTSKTIKRPIRGLIWESTRLGNTRDLCNQTKYGIEPVFANQNMVNQKMKYQCTSETSPCCFPGMWTTHFGEERLWGPIATDATACLIGRIFWNMDHLRKLQ